MKDLEARLRQALRREIEEAEPQLRAEGRGVEHGVEPRRRMIGAAIGLMTAAVFVAGLLGAAIWLDRARDRQASGEGQPTTAPVKCETASFRPTYLPWVPPGDPMPDPFVPEPGTGDQPENAALVWFEDDERMYEFPAMYVSLMTLHDPPDLEAATAEQIEVRGTIGWMTWVGDPGVGELRLDWSEGAGPCRSYALAISTHTLPEQRAISELEKIAESLSP